MHKAFIDGIVCTKKHYIFTGKNALQQALYFDNNNSIATPNQLYKLKSLLERSTSWGNCKSKNSVRGTEVNGDGVHAKMYVTANQSVILSSQNNGSSPLFEFAILYKGKGSNMRDIFKFINKSIDRAAAYSDWWKLNNKWKT